MFAHPDQRSAHSHRGKDRKRESLEISPFRILRLVRQKLKTNPVEIRMFFCVVLAKRVGR